jgi:arginine-tRNA-protein transferase
MQSLLVYSSPPGPCGYLPDQTWQLTYELVAGMSAGEYQARLLAGWRRFGHSLFRPACPSCTACRSLRVPVAAFRPDRSQRRALAANAGDVVIRIGTPSATRAKLELHDRYHAFQQSHRGWPEHAPIDPATYAESFLENPIPTQEWCYYLRGKLVGVGYVDRVPAGLSAIYFIHDPDERSRSLGTFNVLSLIQKAREWRLPHVYLGYYVAGCSSLEYKARFRPNEVLGADGAWTAFR